MLTLAAGVPRRAAGSQAHCDSSNIRRATARTRSSRSPESNGDSRSEVCTLATTLALPQVDDVEIDPPCKRCADIALSPLIPRPNGGTMSGAMKGGPLVVAGRQIVAAAGIVSLNSRILASGLLRSPCLSPRSGGRAFRLNIRSPEMSRLAFRLQNHDFAQREPGFDTSQVRVAPKGHASQRRTRWERWP
jgi:hypothetical protein